MKKNIISILFYIVASLFILLYCIAEITPNLTLSEMGRLFLLCSSCLFLYIAGVLKSKYKNNNKALKINLWIFLGLYLTLLITLTMFDPMWGRNRGFEWTKEKFDIYIENSINLIPFKTIIEYAQKMFTSLLDRKTVFLNLFGNVVCLMPFALFIPLLFKKINNTKRFLFSVLGISLGIEIIQFITCVGSCDIDDIILNTIGTLIAYRILNISEINNLIKNIFLLEQNKIDKKKVLIVAVPIIIICVLILGLYKVSQNNYNQNLEEHIAKWNYKIEIVDESDEDSLQLEKIYENELYEYYLDSAKINKVYAIINDTEKHLVKDLLNNNTTEYKITIDKFEMAGLEFIIKEKYPKIDVTIEGNVGIKYQIENQEILDIGYGKQINDENTSSFELFIIPKTSGITNITLNFINYMENEIVEIKEYTVTINENLELQYSEI